MAPSSLNRGTSLDHISDKLDRVEQPIISVTNLSKKYCHGLRRSLFYGLVDIGREIFYRSHNGAETEIRKGEFWALKDVSFELKRGDSLAILGANGAGKSTLLKVLHGLIKPDGGRVVIDGRIEALIELGTGFNQILTGRENIYISAALFGLSRRQVDQLMDKITDFAGIGEFIDTPVQYYSSGMKARLSYAVAVHLNPDVLLVDEVLAVGDITFQRKCMRHMQSYIEAGGSLIFVSHSAFQIQSICQRGIVLEKGRLTYSGTAVEALNYYLENQNSAPQPTSTAAKMVALNEDNPVAIESLTLAPIDGDVIQTGDDVRLTLKYQALASIREHKITWGFTIWTGDQWVCISGNVNTELCNLEIGANELTCVIPKLPLVSGHYLLKATIVDAATLQPLALYGWYDSPLPFTVCSRPSLLNNAFAAANQLMLIDVEWE